MDDCISEISQGLEKNNSLRHIDLSDNLFTHQGLDDLCLAINNRKLLIKLNLDGNNLEFLPLIEQDQQQSKAESYFNNVNHLSLVSIKQSESDFNFICKLIKNNICQLQHIDLSYNKWLSEKNFQDLAQGIKLNNGKLKELILINTINGDLTKLFTLLQGISTNQNLSLLDISSNDISDQGIILISDEIIQKNNGLKVIKILNDKTFGCKSLQILYKNLEKNQKLKSIEISKDDNSQLNCIIQQINNYLHKNNQLQQQINGNRQQQNQEQQQQLVDSQQVNNQDQQQGLIYSQLKGRNESSDIYRIGLSIDGGGMRGIIPAICINYLCNQVKREAHEIFDIIGGTSIGGILALGSTGTLDNKHPVVDHNEIVNLFEEHGQKIFDNSKNFKFASIFQSSYSAAGIESVLNKYFQNSKLSDVLPDTNVIITSVHREIRQGKSSAKIFNSKLALLSDKKNFYMRDVARATSAAPTYFPSAEIKNINGTKEYSLIDGGVGQNNPSKIVLNEIKKEAVVSGNENNFFLVSLDTGCLQSSAQISKNNAKADAIQIIEILNDSPNDYLEQDIKKNYPGKYVRVKTKLPVDKKNAELDCTDKNLLKIYKDEALQEAQKVFNNEVKYGKYEDRSLIDWFSENTAKKKDFYL